MQPSTTKVRPGNFDKSQLKEEILVDVKSPVDRRFLNEQFHVVMSRYRLDQTKLAEYSKISNSTMSTLYGSGNTVSWTTWESVIAGLIQYHPNAALSFWLGLRPCIQKSIRNNTVNTTILDYITEIDSINSLDSTIAKDTIKSILDKLDPNLVDRSFLKDIEHLRTKDIDVPEKANLNGFTSNIDCYFSRPINITLNLPAGTRTDSQEISKLIAAILQNTETDQEKKSQ